MRRRARSGSAFPESMLDLIWILLFFFLMISTVRTARTPTVLIERVPYLEEGAQRDVEQKRAVSITITADGKILLANEAVELANLDATLRELKAADGHPPVLVLAVDRAARVEDLLRVEDVARSAGLELVIQREEAVESATP